MKIRLCILFLWTIIDPIYYTCTRLTSIDQRAKKQKNVLRVRLTRYKGRELILSDGTPIYRNDLLIKIHLHNIRLLRELKDTKSDIRRAFYIYRCMEKSLPELVEYINNHPNHHEIKGIIGITTLNRGSVRLGFETIMMTNPWYRALKWVTQLPIYCLSVSKPSFQNLKKHIPGYLLMSKQTLVNSYGQRNRELF